MKETELRWQLRQLPREVESRDLWPGIAAAIERKPLPARPRWHLALAFAASVALALGLAWQMAPVATPGAPLAAAGKDPQARMLQLEASALDREYHAALGELATVPVPGDLQPGLRVLDDSAEQIRRAMAANPDSPVLLQQLRRTYSRRLELTQRAVTG